MPRCHAALFTASHIGHTELLKLRRQSIDESLNTIILHSFVNQNRIFYEDLALLKRNFMEHGVTDKLNFR